MSIFQSLRLDPEANLPLAAQLSQQITWLVASGAIAQGDSLLPVRELAKNLGFTCTPCGRRTA